MNLALFFTFGISAQIWKAKGLLDREKLLYEQLLKSGEIDRIYWFTYGTADKEIEKELKDGIEIIPMPALFNSKVMMRLYSLLLPLIHFRTLLHATILKTNQMNGAWTAVIAKMLLNKPLIVRTGYTWSIFAEKENAGTARSVMISQVEKLACTYSDGLVVSSQDDLNYLKKTYALAEKGRVIPNYIDTDLFTPLPEKKEKNSICFVGRLNSQKNLMSLLEALIGLPYKLSIVGSGEDQARLSGYAKENDLNVNFLGDIENNKLPAILNEHELFILPSLYEGTPKALLEAMACGLPCIGTDVDGINGIIIHNENGVLCSTDPESINKALSTVFSDASLRARLSQNSRKTIIDNFSINRYMEEELSLYKTVCL